MSFKRTGALHARFESRFAIATTGCWEWLAQLNPYGYGMFGLGRRGVMVLAHRYSWERANGAIPDGACVLHRCDNRKCVNPGHLFLGSKQDNVDDMWNKRRGARQPRQAKLSDDDVALIRSALVGGEAGKSVAERFGVSESHISMIKHGQKRTRTSPPLTRADIDSVLPAPKTDRPQPWNADDAEYES